MAQSYQKLVFEAEMFLKLLRKEFTWALKPR